jgi:shikimate dehydrogenase
VWPTSATRLAGVMGDPVRHSLSPVLHNAAFAAVGLDWVYVALEVREGDAVAALGAVRALGFEGLSVTMPHKETVALAVDRLTSVAERLGAANTVVRRGRDLVGDSTDGAGFIDALRLDEGYSPEHRRFAVLGTGGAARAVVLAVAQAGAASVVVIGRTPDRARAAATLAGPVGRVGRLEDVGDAEVVVNATPVGMDAVRPLRPEDGGELGLPLDLDLGRLGPGQLVVDLVYSPAVTPLLDAARKQGAVAVNGLGMLIHQAAHQFRLWTGEAPPLEAMSAAGLAALARDEGRQPAP